MFRIGYRTIKTAIGASISIAIAEWLQLDFYTAAGIITILCISITKRSSLRISWERLVACLLGLAFAIVFFELIGYHPLALAILALLFIPTVIKAKAKEGIVTSFVIILHVYTLQFVTLSVILNELLLIIIGIGVALMMNLYIPSNEKELLAYQKKVESNFKIILHELTIFLRNGESEWDGKELTETVAVLERAKNKALQNIENHLLRYEDRYFYYFKMRERQFEILERILPYISCIDANVEQAEKVADFLEELSEAVSPHNRTMFFLTKLRALKEDFSKEPLPKTRQEFEIRSSIMHVVQEIEQYLIIKYTLSTTGKVE